MKRDYIKLKLKINVKEGTLSARSRNQDSFLFVIHTTANTFQDSMRHTWPSDFLLGRFLGRFPSGIFSDFQDSFVFGKATSLHFDTRSTFLKQQFLQSSCFFWGGPSRKTHFLVAAAFSEYLIFLSKTSTEQPLFKNNKFFRPVTSWNS